MRRDAPDRLGGGRRVSRRGLLRALAAAAGLPLGVLALRQVGGTPVPVQWSGAALDSQGGLTLWHPDPAVSRRAIARVRTEVERLERIFSLYRPDSEIARLNRDGRLGAPSRDLVTVLDEARRIAEVSRGAFDPTIQPLWRVLAGRHLPGGASPATNADGFAEDLAAARRMIDFTAIDAAPRGITLGGSGMAITLNGIAQGYVTDRIADLLRDSGFDQAMVELGETRALGAAPDGRPFRVALVAPASAGVAPRWVDLADEALSVSGGYGLRFGAGGAHHLLDPVTGRSPNHLLDVAVLAPRAMWADALSTAIFVAGEAAAPAILAAYPGARTILTRSDGSRAVL